MAVLQCGVPFQLARWIYRACDPRQTKRGTTDKSVSRSKPHWICRRCWRTNGHRNAPWRYFHSCTYGYRAQQWRADLSVAGGSGRGDRRRPWYPCQARQESWKRFARKWKRRFVKDILKRAYSPEYMPWVNTWRATSRRAAANPMKCRIARCCCSKAGSYILTLNRCLTWGNE